MSIRKIMDALDLDTGEKIYFNSHAKATFLSDGTNVEDRIKEIPEMIVVPTMVSELENDANYVSEQKAKSYTDQKIAELVDSAPETLNTLKELASAIETSSDAIELLNTAIGEKADKSELRAGMSQVSSIANLPTNKAFVYATISTSSTMSLSTNLEAGAVLHVIVYNAGNSEIRVTLNISGGKYLDAINTLDLSAGGYAEVSIIGGGSNIGHFVRSVY